MPLVGLQHREIVPTMAAAIERHDMAQDTRIDPAPEQIFEIREVPWAPGYFITTNGDVLSLKRSKQNGVDFARKLVTAISSNGYLIVSLCQKNRTKTQSVHILVLETFIGPCPDGLEGCHNDGNKLNCHLDNLRWDTRKSNAADRIKHKTDFSGARNPSAKVQKPEDIERIIYMFRHGFCTTKISQIMNIHSTTVGRILTKHCHEYNGKEKNRDALLRGLATRKARAASGGKY
jgi:hypothetical protein